MWSNNALMVQTWCGVPRYCWMIFRHMKPGMCDKVQHSTQHGNARQSTAQSTAPHGMAATARRCSAELVLLCDGIMISS